MKDYKRFRVDVSPIHEVFGNHKIIDRMLFRWWNKWVERFFYNYDNISSFEQFLHDEFTDEEIEKLSVSKYITTKENN